MMQCDSCLASIHLNIFFPAFDPKIELLQDKYQLPSLKKCFQLFFISFLLTWKGSCQGKTGRRIIQTDLGFDLQNVLCRFVLGGCM